MARGELQELVAQAQEAEKLGLKEIAADKYKDAATLLMTASSTTPNVSEKAQYTLQASEYLQHCNALLAATVTSTAPAPAPAPAPTATAPEPTATPTDSLTRPLLSEAAPVASMPAASMPAAYSSMPAPEAPSTPSPTAEAASAEVRPYGLPAGPSEDAGDGFSEAEIKSGAGFMGASLGAGLGSLLGLPIVGGVAGWATAKKLVSNDSPNGRSAREMGLVGARVLRRAKSFNRTHRVTERAREAVGRAVSTSTELNEKHDLSGKAMRAASAAGAKVVELDHELGVSSGVSRMASEGVASLTKQDPSRVAPGPQEEPK